MSVYYHYPCVSISINIRSSINTSVSVYYQYPYIIVGAARNLCDAFTEIIKTLSQKGLQFSDIDVSPHRRVVDSQVSQVSQAGKLAIWQACELADCLPAGRLQACNLACGQPCRMAGWRAGKLASRRLTKLASWQAGSEAVWRLASSQAGGLASWQAGKLAGWQKRRISLKATLCFAQQNPIIVLGVTLCFA